MFKRGRYVGEPCLSGPERGVRLAAKLVEAVVDGSLEHAVLQESDKGSWGADLTPGVVEGDLHIGVLLLLIHKGAQPWLAVWRQLIPATLQIVTSDVFWDGKACCHTCNAGLHKSHLHARW